MIKVSDALKASKLKAQTMGTTIKEKYAIIMSRHCINTLRDATLMVAYKSPSISNTNQPQQKYCTLCIALLYICLLCNRFFKCMSDVCNKKFIPLAMKPRVMCSIQQRIWDNFILLYISEEQIQQIQGVASTTRAENTNKIFHGISSFFYIFFCHL